MHLSQGLWGKWTLTWYRQFSNQMRAHRKTYLFSLLICLFLTIIFISIGLDAKLTGALNRRLCAIRKLIVVRLALCLLYHS